VFKQQVFNTEQIGVAEFEVLKAASMKMAVFWVAALMMEAASTSEASVNFFHPT
jgi:hypothetical protein